MDVDPHGSCDNLGAFASVYAAHGANAHLFRRRVIQLASIVCGLIPVSVSVFPNSLDGEDRAQTRHR
jgi:hypothetical protein